MEQQPHICGALSGSNAISISYSYSKFSPPMLFTLCSGAFALFFRRANYASLGLAVLLCLVFIQASEGVHLGSRRIPKQQTLTSVAGVHLDISCFYPLGRIGEPTKLLKIFIYINSIVSLLIIIVLLLIVPTPTFIVVIPII